MENVSVLDCLNELQQEIVLAPLSNMLVIAGAGTGKTRVLISRIAYLIDAENVAPRNILAVTFTNKAAKEMSERINAFFNWDNSNGMLIATFHSMCYRFLRIYAAEAMLPKDFSVITTSDQLSIIKGIFKDLELKDETLKSICLDEEFTPRIALESIMALKEQGKDPVGNAKDLENELQNFSKNIHKQTSESLLNLIFFAYQNNCEKSSLLDFADLLNRMKKLLISNSNVRFALQKRYRHIFVDEFQDTNSLQYEILMLLHSENSYLFVVGDDDQAIYGWRGADYTNLIKLRNDIPNIDLYELTINYRSNQNILTFSNAVVAHNNKRLLNKQLVNIERFEQMYATDRELFVKYLKCRTSLDENEISARALRELIDRSLTDNVVPAFEARIRNFISYTGDENANKVRIIHMPSSKVEAKCVGHLITRLKCRGVKEQDIAILYRNNYLSANIEEMLSAKQIPYSIYGGLKFFERAEVLNTIAYLRLMLNTKDDAAFKRVINVPKRGVGPKSVEKLEEHANSIGLSCFEALEAIIQSNDKAGMKLIKKMIPFYELIVSLRKFIDSIPLHSLVSRVIFNTGLLGMYEEMDIAEDAHKTGLGRVKNLEQLVSIAENFDINNIKNDIELEQELRDEFEKTSMFALAENDLDNPDNVPTASKSNKKINHNKLPVFTLLDAIEDEEFLSSEDSIHVDLIKDHNDIETADEANQANSSGNIDPLSRKEIFEQFVVNAALSSSSEVSENGSVENSGIQMMTIHASKGLEFKAVIVIGCEESILPSQRSDDEEEEYRLAYVAFTRAKKDLYILSSEIRYGYGGHTAGGGVSPIVKNALEYLSPSLDYKSCPYSAFYFNGQDFEQRS